MAESKIKNSKPKEDMIYVGMGQSSVTINLKKYCSPSHAGIVLVSTTSDKEAQLLNNGCVVMVGWGGARIISQGTDSYITFSTNGYNLVINQSVGFAYGVYAKLWALTPWD